MIIETKIGKIDSGRHSYYYEKKGLGGKKLYPITFYTPFLFSFLLLKKIYKEYIHTKKRCIYKLHIKGIVEKKNRIRNVKKRSPAIVFHPNPILTTK